MKPKTGKLPYFPFYPKDWFADAKVLCMTCEERGAYVNLLACEWNEGGLPTDESMLASISGLGKRWKKMSTKILACFVKRGEVLVNPKLQKLRDERAVFIEKCREAGNKSAEIRYGDGKDS